MAISNLFRAIIVASVVSVGSVTSAAHAQSPRDVRGQLKLPDSSRLQILTLRDGSSLVGRIAAIGQDTVVVESGVGRVSVPIISVTRIREIDAANMKNGEYWFPNPNDTRLFFAPSGRMLDKGDGYVSDYEVFFPGAAYGVTDNVSIGGGVSLFPADINNQIFFVTPKIGAAIRKDVNVAVGALIIGGVPDESTVGVVYGVGTFGPPDASITAGLGYGFAGTTIARNPVAMIGGELRVARRIALVSENYIIPSSEVNPLYSYGVRLMGEKLTVDLALFNVSGNAHAGIGFPFVDFVFRF